MSFPGASPERKLSSSKHCHPVHSDCERGVAGAPGFCCPDFLPQGTVSLTCQQVEAASLLGPTVTGEGTEAHTFKFLHLTCLWVKHWLWGHIVLPYLNAAICLPRPVSLSFHHWVNVLLPVWFYHQHLYFKCFPSLRLRLVTSLESLHYWEALVTVRL